MCPQWVGWGGDLVEAGVGMGTGGIRLGEDRESRKRRLAEATGMERGVSISETI